MYLQKANRTLCYVALLKRKTVFHKDVNTSALTNQPMWSFNSDRPSTNTYTNKVAQYLVRKPGHDSEAASDFEREIELASAAEDRDGHRMQSNIVHEMDMEAHTPQNTAKAKAIMQTIQRQVARNRREEKTDAELAFVNAQGLATTTLLDTRQFNRSQCPHRAHRACVH